MSRYEWYEIKSTAKVPCPDCWGRLRYGEIWDGHGEEDSDHVGVVIRCEDCRREWKTFDSHDNGVVFPDGVFDDEGLLIGYSDDGMYIHDPENGKTFPPACAKCEQLGAWTHGETWYCCQHYIEVSGTGPCIPQTVYE